MSFLQIKKPGKSEWLGIALFNLSIVALLGLTLRSKILFNIPFVDFKNWLHAHSHFAFGGWITLALATLMVFEILPKAYSSGRVYLWLLSGILFTSLGMLFSFPVQGYAFFSILFSTLFIFISYAFTLVFISHLLKSAASQTVRLLCIGALIYLALSSVGPFTLAYLLAHKSGNAILYRDSIYTYLHLQYNGFFSLVVFALLLNRIDNLLLPTEARRVHLFAILLALSVLPSMFLCYLWHYPGILLRIVASIGSILMILSAVQFLFAFAPVMRFTKRIHPVVRNIGGLSFAAFVLKMVFQSLTLFRSVGDLVFVNRPIIIGFLHMVLLGFITLYLITHMVQAGYLKPNIITQSAIYLFASAVSFNTAVLMTQGLVLMFGYNSSIFNWLLWVIAILMFSGSVLLLVARNNSKMSIISGSKIFHSTHTLIK